MNKESLWTPEGEISVSEILARGKKEQVSRASSPENVIIFPDKKELHVSWRRNFERIKDLQNLVKSAEIVQEEARVNVPLDYPDLPALVWFPSDMHIGSDKTDYDLLEKHINLTIKTPNTFAVFVGDDVDFGIWGSLQFEAALPPYMQGFTIRDLVRELGGENERKKPLVLARVTGNHTDWMFSVTGENWESIWYEETKAPVFPGVGKLELNVGEEKYEVVLAHMYWGRSKLNPTNACKRLIEHEYPNADVAVIGHDHISEVLEFYRGGKKRVAIRSGTYKLTDYYARKHGISLRGQRGGIGCLFYSAKHEIVPFLKLEDAVEYLNALIELKTLTS